MKPLLFSALWVVFSGLSLPANKQNIYTVVTSPIAIQPCGDQYIVKEGSGKPPNSWRGLIPLRSTRTDVEKMLGKATWSHGSTFIYETSCGRLDVLYSKGACELTDLQRWDVPQDVVIKMEFSPQRKLLVKDLKLPSERYSRDQETHPENWIQYRSAEDGISITAVRDGKRDIVGVITFKPTKQDDRLRCPHP